ncbi:unnamed protein product, partial [Brenthis ino]
MMRSIAVALTTYVLVCFITAAKEHVRSGYEARCTPRGYREPLLVVGSLLTRRRREGTQYLSRHNESRTSE